MIPRAKKYLQKDYPVSQRQLLWLKSDAIIMPILEPP